MITLVLGEPNGTRQLIESVARERGHEVILTAAPEDAREEVLRSQPSLVVVVGLSQSYRQFCAELKQSRIGDRLILLVVLETKVRGYQERLLEANADDYVLGTRTPDRVNARLAFVERKIELLNERTSALSQLEQRARQQAAVAELGRRALAGASVDELMELAVRSTASTLDVDVCKVMERISGSDELRQRIRHGSLDVSHQSGSDPLDDPTRMVSGMSVVISAEKRSFGVLSVHTSRKRNFNEEDVNFLRVVANVLAAALERRNAEEALMESEAKARAILDTTVDAIITIDADGLVESYNQAAEKIFGYGADEVIGENIKMLMPSPYREEHDGYIRSYHDTGRRNIIGIGREVTGRRKDGSVFPMDLSVSEVQLGDRKIFTGIIRDITERRTLEQRILQISDEERRRIGQDLHDGLGQMLTGIGLIGQSLTRKMEQEGHHLAANVAEVTDLVKEADQFARALARGLVPVELEANGLSAALRRLVDNAERLFGVSCRFEEVGGTALIEDNTAVTHFYRIAQEAVSNAVKHGKASEVTITLASAPDKVRLRVRDDGIGFPKKLSKDRGMGVNIMHYRARIIGGALDIRRDPAGGTVLTCTMPLLPTRRPKLETVNS
jgi:two-component system, LuxR family, sensor kinase FixL